MMNVLSRRGKLTSAGRGRGAMRESEGEGR